MTPNPITRTAEFTLGDIVYLRVRDDKVRGMVTAITIVPGGAVYAVTWGNNGTDTRQYAMELSSEYVAEYT